MSNAAIQVEETIEGRTHPRSHLFVIATLYSDDGSQPVHVRNMSLVGAHVEGSALPEPGAVVVLRRGSLEARGRMAWKVGRKGGIALSGAVEIADWMAKPPARQEQVDTIICDFKSRRPAALSSAREEAVAAGQGDRDELEALKAELAQLGNVLSRDVIVVATHPEIQLIDVALQRIDRLIARHESRKN